MAIATIKTLPLFLPTAYSAGATTNVTLDTTDDWLAWVFYWPGGDLTKCAFATGPTVSGSPVVTAQVFDVSATDGTVTTASAIGSAVDSATLAASTVYQISGIGQASLAAGVYALRLIFKSGTSVQIRQAQAGLSVAANVSQFPYVVTVANGGAQTLARVNCPLLSLGGSSFVNADGFSPACIVTSPTAWADTSNPDEYGLWFLNPLPHAVRISSVLFFNNSGSRPDIRLALYSGSLASPVAEVTQTFDRDQVGSTSTNGFNWFHLSSANHYRLAAGASMGIGLRAATTHNMQIHYLAFGSGNEAVMDSWWGQNAYLFTREGDTGALTGTTNATPLIYPCIDGIDTTSRKSKYRIGA